MLLNEVCQIQSGFSARGKLSESPLGTPALHLRDLPAETGWAAPLPIKYDLGQVAQRYFAGPGSVLFRSRGSTNTACAISEDWEFSAVAILPLIIFRPNIELIRPQYLAWAINQPATQALFDRRARGTSLRMIPRSVLDEVEFDVPDLQTQDLVLNIADMANTAFDLETKLASLRRELASSFCHQAIHQHSQHTNLGART